MRTIAIETTEKTGTIALLDGDQPVAAQTLPADQRSAQSLAAGIQELLSSQSWRPRDVQLVAVSAGPGSFTGLRIGVTTAKTFAYVVGAEVLGVNTLEVIAAAAPPTAQPLWVAIDAQRQQVFAAQFETDGQHCRFVRDTRILDQAELLGQLAQGDWITGPILSALANRLPNGVQIVESQLWAPSATSVGRVAYRHYQAGRRDDVWQLVPQYYRKSAAEEKIP